MLLGSSKTASVLKQLGVPGRRWEVTLLGVDLVHGLTKLSRHSFRFGMERKAFRVLSHFVEPKHRMRVFSLLCGT